MDTYHIENEGGSYIADRLEVITERNANRAEFGYSIVDDLEFIVRVLTYMGIKQVPDGWGYVSLGTHGREGNIYAVGV